jgi:serine/threonine protein kinase/tetratricopeptide (TPR) repeat protein
MTGDDLLVGVTFDGRYMLAEPIGAGGMGQVYRAVQHKLSREVAVKVLGPHVALRPRAVARFHAEARAASRLEHPNIVRVYDFGHADTGHLYIAMELVRGESLKALLRRERRLTAERAIALLDQVLAALEAAHQAGVIHRDLKPDNAMVVTKGGREHLVVLDFGIAKVLEDGAAGHDSVTREVMGTPEYMAPEQILGEEVGPPTDLYAVGINLFELVAGERPFGGRSAVQVYLAHLNQPVPPLPANLDLEPARRAALDAVIAGFLAKERSQRFPTATAAREALAAWLRRDPAPFALSQPQRPKEPEPVAHGTLGELTLEQSRPDTVIVRRMSPAELGTDPSRAAALPSMTSQHQERRDIVVLTAALAPGRGAEQPADPEDQLGATAPVVASWSRIARAAGGVVLHGQPQAPGVIQVAFGAPLALEGFALRAVRAALQMRLAAEKCGALPGTAFDFRAGVASGLAIVSSQTNQGGLEVVGEVLVRSQWLAADAPAGGILVSDLVYEDCRGRVLGAPAAASSNSPGARHWRVTGLRPRDAHDTPLVAGVRTRTVGRGAERAQLQQLLLDSLDKQTGRMVVLSGEAGIGKTRMVRDLVAWAGSALPHVQVVLSATEPSGEESPYALPRQLVAQLRSLAHDTPPPAVVETLHSATADRPSGELSIETAEALALVLGLCPEEHTHTLPRTGPPRDLERRAFQGFSRLVLASGERPLIWLVEDLHWADEGSLDWLDELARGLVAAPVVVVATTRPGALARRPELRSDGPFRTHLELLPLKHEKAVALVGELLQNAPGPADELHRFVVERAAGNPFYAEELVKALIARAVLVPDATGKLSLDRAMFDPELLPRSIQALLQARIDSVEPVARTVLLAASVVGRTFWKGAVEALLDRDAVGALDLALEQLDSEGFIFVRATSALPGEMEYQFEHALLREVAYASLLRATRRECHAAVARWLQARLPERQAELHGTVARHAEGGGDLARAFDGYVRAGEHAARVYANEDALRLLTKATELASTAPEVPREGLVRAAAARGDVLELLSRFSEAREAFEQALAALSARASVLERAELARRRARALYRAGELERARADLLAVQSAVAGAPSAVRLAVAADLAWLFHLSGQHADARRELSVVLPPDPDAAPPPGVDAVAWVRALANVHNTLGTVHLRQGRPLDALLAYEQARLGYEKVGARHAAAACLLNEGIVRLAQGQAERARPALESALAEFLDLGYAHGAANAKVYLGHVARARGQLARASELAQEARQWAESAGVALLRAEALALCAELRIDSSDLHAAVELARAAVEAARASRSRETEGLACRVLGEALRALSEAAAPTERAALVAEARRQLLHARAMLTGDVRLDELSKVEGLLADLPERAP